ncbi:hypothetical protein [Roseimicrobium sp. ORNL1]|uniref:hypothetical protein n=1 Tax=Roseimicrobium sp. ORNL1 TaxID=2711231 RepID=UPI0013E1456E|nr:hypothetical protein [Roseimicrobium sp. ORNL1]QIF02445.1 hypothetical protein G5S37_13225 [Roseimicrobium sp. ORNL1]
MCAIVVCAVAASLAHAADPYVFRYLDNALGFADKQGSLCNWWNADEKIVLDGETELPVRFLFTSSQRNVADGCLGHGWWFPLFESTVVQSDEGKVLMHAPGGFVFHLLQDAKNADKYASPDGLMEGRLLSGDGFEVKDHKGGWGFRFHKGRLQEAVTPTGDELRWIYEGTRVVKLTSKKKGDLITARYNQEGLLERFDLTQSKYWTQFGYTQYPLMAKVLEKAVPVRMVQSVGAVKAPGFDGRINYEPDTEAESLAMKVNYVSQATGKKLTENYSWDLNSGHILTDPSHTYTLTFPESVGAGPSKVVRTDAAGKSESYSYDTKTGVWEHLKKSGAVDRYHYVLTPGPNYGKVRRRDLLKAGSDSGFLKVYEASWDSAGRTLREIGENYSVTWQYGQDGSVVDCTVVDLTTGKRTSVTNMLKTIVP